MLPAETPKLAKWPFLLGDAVLLGLAWLIANQSRTPFTGPPLVWIVVCVVVAAVLGAVPFLADYARKQDEALDERQHGLEAISRTVAASAEQIGIAANGLHELTDLAQRNLKAAGQLGPGLEEKVAALKTELTAARDDERAALRKEVAALRTADFARVETAAQQLAKTAAEIARAEAALQKQIAAARELCATAETLASAINGATAALTAARASSDTAPAADKSTATVEAAAETPAAKPEPRRSRKSAPPAAATDSPVDGSAPAVATEPAQEIPAVETVPIFVPAPAAAEPSPGPEAASPPAVAAPAAIPAGVEPGAPAPVRKRAPRKPRGDPAAGADTEPIVEIPPAAPTASPSAGATAEPIRNTADEDVPPAESDEAAKAIEQSRSSDGATRLLVTAYIGIGNRLFIRGEGPGLSWEKGLPLQFVSIGKWRWESADAAGPVKYKLYKNDALECTALGEQQVDPGQQQEVSAAF